MTLRRIHAALVFAAATGAGAAFAVEYANVCTGWVADIVVFEVYSAAALLVMMSIVIVAFRRFHAAGQACLAAVTLCLAFWGSAHILGATGHIRWGHEATRESSSTRR